VASDRQRLEIVAYFRDKASRQIQSLGRSITSLGKTALKVSSMIGGLAAAFGAFKAVQWTIRGVTSAWRGLVEGFKQGLIEGSKSELQLQKVDFIAEQLGETLIATTQRIEQVEGAFVGVQVPADRAGQQMGSLRERVADLANDLQRLSGIGDDQIVATFNRIALESGKVEESMDATRLAVELSIATGRDLRRITEALANAMAGETERLKYLLPSLRDVNFEGKSQAEVLSIIRERYSGLADAVKNNPITVLAALKAETVDLWKSLFDAEALNRFGEGLRSVVDALDRFNATKIFEGIGAEFSDNVLMASDALSVFIDTLSDPKVQQNILDFLDAIGLIGDAGEDLRGGSVFDAAGSAVTRLFMQLSHELRTLDQEKIARLIEHIKQLRLEAQQWLESIFNRIGGAVADVERMAAALERLVNVLDKLAHPGRTIKEGFWEFAQSWSESMAGFASGGRIPGVYSGRDTVPALLSPGEVVLAPWQQAAIGHMFGAPPDEVFAAAGVPGFAKGGPVIPSPESLQKWREEFEKMLAAAKRDDTETLIIGRGMTVAERRALLNSLFQRRHEALAGPDGADRDPLFGPSTGDPWGALKAAIAAADIKAVERIAQAVASNIAMARRFPAVGIGADPLGPSKMEAKLRKYLDLAHSRMGNWSVERMARGYATGGLVGRAPASNRRFRRRRVSGLGGGQFILQTVAADEESVRRFGLTVRRLTMPWYQRDFARRGWRNYTRFEV